MTNNKKVWTRIWSRDFSRDENRTDIERERQSVRWRKIRKAILKQHQTFSGLRVIEIGAGRGIYALLTALEGCSVTLLDNNKLALERAKEFFNEWERSFEGVYADAFSLPQELAGGFDIAMSFGLAEHFRYPERFQIFESHLRLLKPGGFLIVSVPNRAFIPYRVGKFLLERLHKWELGLEIPFSRRELRRIAGGLSLRNWKIIGSGVVNDTSNFWLTQRLLHLPRFVWEKFSERLRSRQGKTCLSLKERLRYFSQNPETWADDYFGYTLTLLGEVSNGPNRY